MADGSITIETLLSTDKFDRQIANLEKKMQKEEDKKIKLDAEINLREQSIQKAKDMLADLPKIIDDTTNQMKILAQEMDNLKIDSPEYDIANQKMTELNVQLEAYRTVWNELPSEISKQERKVDDLKGKYVEINRNVDDYKTKIEGIKLQKHKADVDSLKNSFKNVGSSIQDSIKKVGRLAIALFGIRSAISLLRSASSELASYDEQYATNLEYIRFVLAQAVAPVLQAIVNLAMQLLSYINAIAQAWFGINLFANGSVENFQKMKKGAQGVGKAVKEVKKELLGFDEINRLTDSDTGTSAGAGGVGASDIMPSMDLSSMQMEIPEWLKWIIDHKDLILSVLGGIGTALLLIKFGLSGIKALGIGMIVAGVLYTLQSIYEYLNDPTLTNFGKIIEGIGLTIMGIGFLIGGLPAIIIGAIILIEGLIIEHWDKIKGFLEKGINWFADKSDWVHEHFGDIIGGIYDAFVENAQRIVDHFDRLFNDVKEIFDGVIEFITGIFEGNWDKAWEGLKKIFINVWDIFVETVDFSLKLIDNFIDNIAEGIANTFWWVVDSVSGWFNDLANNITTVFQWVIDSIGNWLWDMATSLPDAISGVIRGAVNALLSFVESMINAPISALNALIGVINSIPGVSIGYLGTVSFPKLAKGSILNAPGRGTLVGGGQAIAGEAGREAYLPLSDHQLLEELGSTIGKYITINAEIVNSMNGRVISRELQQIQNGNAFAYNS